MKRFLIALNLIIWTVVAVEAKADSFSLYGSMATGTYEERYERCLNEFGSIWAFGRKDYCVSNVPKQTYADTKREQEARQAEFARDLERRIVIERQQAEEERKVRIAKEEQAKKEMDAYLAKIEKERKEEAAKEQAERDRLSKLPGVRIGMTSVEVRTRTNWGAPRSVNRTTTAYGTREQWVYWGNNYLYFTNGILTAVQN